MSIEFMAETEEAAVKTMLATIRKCGPEFKDITSLKEGVDYEVV
jgi:hypothetical protein